jgi:hypothetical protein
MGLVRALSNLLGRQHGDHVRKELCGAHALSVLWQHDRDLDTEAAGTHVHVALASVDKVLRVAGLDHVPIAELHLLGTLALDLATDADVAALGTGVHDEADDADAGTADREGAQELELEGLGLGRGGEATELDALDVELDTTLWVAEALLDGGCELADATTLLAQDLLRLRGADDDFGAAWRHAVLNATEAVLGQLTLEVLKELGVKDAVTDELALLADWAHSAYL